MVSAFKARENMNVAIRPGSKPSLRKPSPLSIVSPSIQVKAQTGQNSVSGSEGELYIFIDVGSFFFLFPFSDHLLGRCFLKALQVLTKLRMLLSLKDSRV